MARNTNSDAERDARRQADRERLERAARALLDSEGWQRWVRVRATNGLARYSFGNQLLIALQKPDATFVAGFRAFLKLNRCVRKGEKSIRILAPMTVRRRGADDTNEDDDKRTVFRAVPVFDVGQTDPLPGREPIALEPPCEPISGDSHARLLTPLENLAAGLGYSIRHLPLDGGADGWCDAQRCEIVVNDHLPVNAQVRVLVHELAHALGIGYRDFGRQRAEVLVDCVTYVVCGSVGLDVAGESVPYVAGWARTAPWTTSASTRRPSTPSRGASKRPSAKPTNAPPTRKAPTPRRWRRKAQPKARDLRTALRSASPGARWT